MLLFDEYLNGVKEVEKLGFDCNNPQFIPEWYLEQKQFIVWRTCHSYGDWILISAMPRLLKEKYPDCTVAIPSPKCIATKYNPKNWLNRSKDPFNNVVDVFINNPYVDGMIDELPANMPVFHDHFRIYDPANLDILIVEQMLKYWRFDPKTITDSPPEMYWSEEEIKKGNEVIEKTFGKDDFGFLYIDDSFYVIDEEKRIPRMSVKRQLIQSKIDEFSNLPWLYYAGTNINETVYKTTTKSIDVRDLKISLRVQSYIKSKSKVVIGHQGGYGTDCVSRYTTCYVIPLYSPAINEHYIRTTKYIR
jgi:hypothetical protein